jgi:ectoine hydroxylase-related dioxygenase (phytanoyl-CoA dioxygenase family)
MHINREPEVIKPFEQLWTTNELLVSFDAFNITLPNRTDMDYTPWPHVDQSPERKGLACVQGFVNCSPAGPDDGGLLLMVGSAALFEQFFKSHPAEERPKTLYDQYDLYLFTAEQVKWYEERGCKLIKVCAEPGDLILWDSRTVHHVALPESETVRTVMYVCYTPAALAKKDDLQLKAELFKKFEATTHWPHCNIHSQGKAIVNGRIDPLERDEPLEKLEITDQILKLAGVKCY